MIDAGDVSVRLRGDKARDLNVEEVRRLSVKAGETVVFKFAHVLTASQRERLVDVIRDAMPEGVKFLVVDAAAVDISVIASEEEAA